MTVKKDGWIVTIAYEYLFAPSKPWSNEVNLCTLFWQFVFGLFIGWPLSIILVASTLALGTFLGFFVGLRPSILKSDKPTNSAFVPIQSLPKIGKDPILPLYIFLPIGTIVLMWNILKQHWTVIKEFWNALLASQVFIIFAGGILLLTLVLWLLYKIKDTEPAKLLKEYLAAKKSRVCPIVRIE